MAVSESDKRMFFEHAKRQAQDEYRKNRADAKAQSTALTRWGGALLELANFENGDNATGMVSEAVEKFHMALEIDPKKPDALWCLGNAYTSQGFLSPEKDSALKLFAKAKDCFMTALSVEPGNDIYKKGLEMTGKAPELYDEIQKQMQPQMGGARAMRSGPSTFWWDVLGYFTVIGTIMCVSAVASVANQGSGPGPKQ